MKLWAITSLGAPTRIRIGKNKLVYIGPKKKARRVYKDLFSAGEREVKMYPFVDILFGVRPCNFDMTAEHLLAREERGKRGYYVRNGKVSTVTKTTDTVATLRRLRRRRGMVSASSESIRRELPDASTTRVPDEVLYSLGSED